MPPAKLHRVARTVFLFAFVVMLTLALLWWWSALEILIVARQSDSARTDGEDSTRAVLWVDSGRVELRIQRMRVRGYAVSTAASGTRWTFDRVTATRGLPRPLSAPAWLRRLGIDALARSERGVATPLSTQPSGVVTRFTFELRTPIWLMMLPFALAFAAAGWRLKRPQRRRRAGLCPSCGYDVRATPERCPECGFADDRVGAAVAPAQQT
jgi:hypothetical protein